MRVPALGRPLACGLPENLCASGRVTTTSEEEETLLPDTMTLPDLPELTDPPDPDRPPSIAPKPTGEDAEALEALPVRDERPALVGLNPAVSVVGARTRPLRRTPRVNLDETFSKADSHGMNQKAADYVRSQLGLGRGGGDDPLQVFGLLALARAEDSLQQGHGGWIVSGGRTQRNPGARPRAVS